MFKGKVLLFSLLLLFATSLYAGDIDPCESWVAIMDTLNGCYQMELSICPQGDMEFIREACGGDADYIQVCALDNSGVGVEGVPWSDYWLQACEETAELCLCCNPINADSLTNEDGVTTISGRVAGGGCITEGGVYIAIQGKIILAKPGCTSPICLDMIVVSPDLNADCRVDLVDLAVFGLSYNCPNPPFPTCVPPKAYNRCCDYNDDGLCNLIDLAYFGEHYYHECL